MTHQLDSGARQWSLLVLVPQDGPMPWATYLPWWTPWTHRRHLARATRTRIWTMTTMDGVKLEIPWGNPSSNSLTDFILQYGIVSKACVEVQRWARVEGFCDWGVRWVRWNANRPGRFWKRWTSFTGWGLGAWEICGTLWDCFHVPCHVSLPSLTQAEHMASARGLVSGFPAEWSCPKIRMRRAAEAVWYCLMKIDEAVKLTKIVQSRV